MIVYALIDDQGHEGYSLPLGIYTTREAAERVQKEEKKRWLDYDIVEYELDPPFVPYVPSVPREHSRHNLDLPELTIKYPKFLYTDLMMKLKSMEQNDNFIWNQTDKI